MNDFAILHLSDLHIDKEGKQLSVLMENLLEDIKTEMNLADNIIIVVTGDIVHRANYKCRKNVLCFFKKLKEILGGRVKGLYIVPGNHDRERNVLDSKVLKHYYYPEKDPTDSFYKNYWKHLRMGFYAHLELVEDIYKIFEMELSGSIKKESYGAEICKINGKNVCFLLFNTAWGSLGDKDERHLKIGDFQMKKIKHEYVTKYEKLKEEGKNIDITIAVAHHPIDWLDGIEEDLVKADILCNNSLNANVYICGHIHNRDVINWQNNRHSLTTLVSGLGWPDGNSNHPYAHTYSSYVFNLDVNSIDVYVRSSDDNYVFEPDFRIYTEKRNKENNKIVMPIDTCKTQAYFDLNTVKNRSPKACFITDDILNGIKDYVTVVSEMRGEVNRALERIKYDSYDMAEANYMKETPSEERKIKLIELEKISEFLFKGGKDREGCYKLVKRHGDWIEMQFTTYLQKICLAMCNALHKVWKNAKVRAHFRYSDKGKGKKYPQLCLSGNGFTKDYVMKVQNWGELLEEAYETGKPLIASVNRRYCTQSLEMNEIKQDNGKAKKWEDFLTVIPKFDKNYHIYKKWEGWSRPLLTFGITVYNENDRKILYVMSYLKIDEMIGDMIEDFLYYFPIDVLRYVRSRKKI